MDDKKNCVHIIINNCSFVLLFVACLIILIQSIYNIDYSFSDDKTYLAEKLVYQQFSHDVYSNINNKILYGFQFVHDYEECPSDKEVLQLPIKLDSFYDCEDIDDSNDEDLDEDICQNTISFGSTCCQKNCCKNNIYVKKTFCRNINTYEEEENDPRKKICKYFNIYNGKFSIIFNKLICAKRYDYNYRDLLSPNENNNCDNNCIYFDSMNHCICDQSIVENYGNVEDIPGYYYTDINFKSNYAIVKNIFSEINPNYFEYETLLKESLINNKYKFDKNEETELNNYKVINIKNIFNAFFKNKQNIVSEEGNKNYYNQRGFSLLDLINNGYENIFKDYQENEYMKRKTINWYTRNYIGFKDYQELEKFRKYFDENDPTKNPLYKISDIMFPNVESLIISIIFILVIFYFMFFQNKLFFKEKNNFSITKIAFSNFIRQISSLALLIIYLLEYLFICIYNYPEINIEMEIYYKFVLEKYNERRNQELLLAAFIILCINFIIELIHYIYLKCNTRNIILNSPSKYTIICKLTKSCDNSEKDFKFYLSRKFSEEMKRFKKNEFFQDFDIDECKIDDKIIDNEKTVVENGLTNGSLIQVICESCESKNE